MEFVAYKKFTDQGSAEEIARMLQEAGIEYRLQDNSHQFVKVVGAHQVDFAVTLNIQSSDFPRADKVLDSYYSQQIESVDKDYYLFEFSEEELQEIISNPYDWGSFDLQLAKHILKEKGIAFDESYIESRKQERIAELSQIKKIPLYKLVLGYTLAFILPPAGLIHGFLIVNHRNILPNGEKFYIHSEDDRRHGRVISGLSIVWAALVILSLIMGRE